MASAVKCADYSARALLCKLPAEIVISDHGFLLERSVADAGKERSYHAEAGYQEAGQKFNDLLRMLSTKR
jgi:hypothetical protein